MPRNAWLALAVLLLAAAPAAALTVGDIPTPRPDGWTVDLAGALDPDTRAALDALGDAVQSQTGGELAVVVVRSLDGRPSRPFALELFNTWGIGRAAEDDGVLLFVSMGDRKVEILLGDGVDGPAEQRVSDATMAGELLPRFRAGDPAGAILAGARALARGIYGATIDDLPSEAPADGLQTAVGLPAGGPATTSGSSGLHPGILGGGALGLLALAGAAFPLIRYRKRRCPDCATPMLRLGEVEDDAHLSAAERTEETVGSVDYDVWLCPRCQRADKHRYPALFSRYRRCPRCSSRTKSRSREVLRQATYSSTGSMRIDESCASCDYSHTEIRTLPRKTESSSSSSSSSGFSGGSSSGGGSSGSW